MDEGPFSAHPHSVTVRVHLTPKSARPSVGPVAAGADGAPVLKARVSAPPEDGKANAELCRSLAKAWNLPKTAVTMVAGASSRHKVVRIDGDAAELLPRLNAWTEVIDA